MPGAFIHEQPATRIIFGVGTLDRLDEELERLGITGAVLISGSTAQARAPRLKRLFGPRCAGWLDSAAAHVPLEVAINARGYTAAVRANGIVAIGGGSAIGLAKAVALTTRLPLSPCPPPTRAPR